MSEQRISDWRDLTHDGQERSQVMPNPHVERNNAREEGFQAGVRSIPKCTCGEGAQVTDPNCPKCNSIRRLPITGNMDEHIAHELLTEARRLLLAHDTEVARLLIEKIDEWMLKQ